MSRDLVSHTADLSYFQDQVPACLTWPLNWALSTCPNYLCTLEIGQLLDWSTTQLVIYANSSQVVATKVGKGIFSRRKQS